MMDKVAVWPVKTRELHNHHMNSTHWNGFEFRDGDIVITTYAKSGTTWMQQIVSQLIFDGAEGIEIHKLSPWVDSRLVPAEALEALEQQTHRRFVKTHLPVDALVFSPRAKYLYVGRDGRDAAWSFFNHFANLKKRVVLMLAAHFNQVFDQWWMFSLESIWVERIKNAWHVRNFRVSSCFCQ